VTNSIGSDNSDIKLREEKVLDMQRMLHANARRLLDYVSGKIPADLRSFVDPQDVLQDTFFEAFQRIGDFTPIGDEASYRWLVTIARHRVLALIRMQRASKRGGGRDRVDDVENVVALLQDLAVYTRTPSQSAMSHEIAAAVQKSMRQIEPHFREVIQLRYLEGLSAKQSAERMGRTEGAIFMLCNRGLKAMKEQLQAGALISYG
jgi:RNA polymerase sigma-70 factor (ECF subfamily)